MKEAVSIDQTPSNWKKVKLTDLCCELQSGKRPKGGVQSIKKGIPSVGGEHLDTQGGFSFTKIKFVPQEFAEQMKKGIIQRNDILVVKDGATTGKTSFVGTDFPYDFAVINEHVFILRVKKNVLSRYVFYKMWSSQGKNEILKDFRGAAQGGISSAFVNNVIIPLPDIEIQHAIVSKIEQLFSKLNKGIESLKTAQQQLTTYRQCVLKWAFEGKLTNEELGRRNEKFSLAVEPNEKYLTNLPKGWKLKKILELVDKISDGPFGSNLKTSDYVERGIRVIRLENIGVMEFRNNFKTYVTQAKYETIKKHTVTKGDIIFSSFISDTIRNVVLPDYIDIAINKADCFLVRCSDTKINKKFLAYFFSSKAMHTQLKAKVHGATRPRINTTQLKSVQIPCPSLAEQQGIVQALETRFCVADKMEESITQSLQQAEGLRQSILERAFEGRLV